MILLNLKIIVITRREPLPGKEVKAKGVRQSLCENNKYLMLVTKVSRQECELIG